MRRLKQELWPHKITLNKVESDPKLYLIEAWLEQNIGLLKGRWIIIYFTNKTDVYFRDSKDATMFSLRWS
jgi:hypothetical protein